MTRVPLPDDLTDEEGLAIFHQLKERLGWAGGVWTRGDAEGEYQQHLQNEHDDKCDDEECDWKPPAMSDVLWGRVWASPYWRKTLGECTDNDWESVQAAIEEALKGHDNEEALRHG